MCHFQYRNTCICKIGNLFQYDNRWQWKPNNHCQWLVLRFLKMNAKNNEWSVQWFWGSLDLCFILRMFYLKFKEIYQFWRYNSMKVRVTYIIFVTLSCVVGVFFLWLNIAFDIRKRDTRQKGVIHIYIEFRL